MGDLELRSIKDFVVDGIPIFKRREERIAFDDAFDQRQIKIGTGSECLGINIRSAADENGPRFVLKIDFVQARNGSDLRMPEA